MNSKTQKKIESLLRKGYTQKEALAETLECLGEVCSMIARRAGIADPRRVMNQLREAGYEIDSTRKVTRLFGEDTVYSLT